MKLTISRRRPTLGVVVALAHHLGIRLELETVDLSKGQQMHPEFVKLDPNHMISTLVVEPYRELTRW